MTVRHLAAALAAAFALAPAARAAAPVPHTFTAGTPAKAAEVNANFQSVVDQIAQAMPAGTVLPYAGATAPPGFLLCDGSAVSKSTYAALFAVVGTSFGSPDAGATSFNLPDLRGAFVRGATNVAARDFAPVAVYFANGDYVSLPGHGLRHTGFPVRFENSGGGLPAPLSASAIYYAIVVDGDSFKVAATQEAALAGTAIDLTTTGTGTHRLVPAADPDASARVASAPGGAAGDAVGSSQVDAIQNFTGSISFSKAGEGITASSGVFAGSTQSLQTIAGHTGTSSMWSAPTIVFDASGSARTSLETRPRNVTLNYIIKY